MSGKSKLSSSQKAATVYVLYNIEHPMIVWINSTIKHIGEYTQQMASKKDSHQFRLGFVAKCILEKKNSSL